MSSIKAIKISNTSEFFIENYTLNIYKHGRLSFLRNLVKIIPKNFFEVLGILTLVILAINLLLQEKLFENFIPIAGVYAVAAFKILPAGNRLLLAFQNLRFDLEAVNILEQEFNDIKKQPIKINL